MIILDDLYRWIIEKKPQIDKYIPNCKECYLLFSGLDVRTHLTVHHQISSDIYLVNLGIKSDVESSEGI